MGILMREMRRSFERYTTYWILMFLVLTLSIAVVFMIWTDMRAARNEYISFSENYYGYTIYNTSFEWSSDELDYFRESDEALNSVKLFFHELKKVHGIQVYNLGSISFKPDASVRSLPDSFLSGYFLDSASPIPGVDPQEGLSALSISSNVYEMFNIKLSEGGMASESSYQYDQGKPVEVVLGSDYREYFQIGDFINGSWQVEKMTLVVVGFLEKGSMVPGDTGAMTVLDKTILIPSFETVLSCNSSDGDVKDFERKIYINKGAPLILLDSDHGDPSELLYETAARTGAATIYCQPVTRASVESLKSATRQNLSLTMILVFSIIAVIMITVITLISMKFKASLQIYAIHMLTGGSARQILLFQASELFLLILPAIGCMVLIIRPFFPFGFPVSVILPRILIMAAGVYALSLVPAIFQLRKLRLSELIRRKHT